MYACQVIAFCSGAESVYLDEIDFVFVFLTHRNTRLKIDIGVKYGGGDKKKRVLSDAIKCTKT